MSDIKPAAPCCQASFCHLWKVFQLLNVTTPATDRWQSEAISFLQQSLYNKQHTPTIQFIIMTFKVLIYCSHIIIHKFQRNASLEQNFRAAMCHVLHYSCNVNTAVADSLRCRMICGTVPSSVHAWMPPATAATWSPAAAHSKPLPWQRERRDRQWSCATTVNLWNILDWRSSGRINQLSVTDLTRTKHGSRKLTVVFKVSKQVIQSHGLQEQPLKQVFHTTVMGKLMYCAIWHGSASVQLLTCWATQLVLASP